MELNENAEIDTSQVQDVGGSGGGFGGRGGGLGIPLPGGGGLVGIIIAVIVALAGGGYGISQLGDSEEPAQAPSGQSLQQQCSQPDKLEQLNCRNALYVNSIQAYWRDALPQSFGEQYQPATTNFFRNAVRTGCGAADSGTGPFYCPADDNVYIDLSFYRLLAQQLGAPGEFAQPYVLAHEYGHHVQDLLGTEAQMRRAQQRDPGNANRYSVMLELQADCYAGAWAAHASSTADRKGTKLFKSLTEQDIQQGIDTAGKIGDDTLQRQSGGRINPAEFTHGTSAQRQQWFRTGYDSGDPKQCDTFQPGAVS